MNETDKLLKLISTCKGSVAIGVNEHRDCYDTIENHLHWLGATIGDGEDDDISTAVYEKIKQAGTVVKIQFYPHTPVGFYVVYDSNLSDALDQCFECFVD